MESESQRSPRPTIAGRRYKLITGVEAFVRDLETAIKRASSTIDLQFHTFEADEIGWCVYKALVAATARGVRVRVLVDHYIDLFHNDYFIYAPTPRGWNSYTDWKDTQAMLADMQALGMEVRRTNPLGLAFRKALYRNHKKLAIVDALAGVNGVAYIGGVNLSAHNARWHDFMVRMKGPIVRHLGRDFEETWRGEALHCRSEAIEDATIVVDTPGESAIVSYVQQLISRATERIVIETPYLWIPATEQLLIRAAKQGVQVALIIPKRSNQPLFRPSLTHLRRLSNHGIEVHRYADNEGMTHAKVLLCDEVVVFGSSNFNELLSGMLAEIAVISSDAGLVDQIGAMLLEDMSVSIRL